MPVCLASALTRLDGPTQSSAGELEDAPLGPLTLAAILEEQGFDVSFVDLDCEVARHTETGPAQNFIERMAGLLASNPATVFGFSTLCGSYPLTLKLTERLKRLRPDSTIVLGGPQASVVDVKTLSQFPHVDFIVRGEADESFPALLRALDSRNPHFHFVPGLAWRTGDSIQRSGDAPPVDDLDALPLPAYHLYRDVKTATAISLELGRGCPFACSFCSTNDFFRRRFRLKSPAAVIRQMKELNARYGVRNFSLVHDMFTVDRRRVVAFCEAMLESATGFAWSCSARTDCVDKELLNLMRQAGCGGIFYGIETGSQALQKAIKKSLNVADALAMVRQTSDSGIPSTASTITGFPNETLEDFRDTVHFIMEAARCDDVEVQLHLLAPLAGTPIAKEHASELLLDRTQSDMSTSPLLTEEEWTWIERSPDIFPGFYHVPLANLDRKYVSRACTFLLGGMKRARWLFVALHQTEGCLVKVFDAWEQWRSNTGCVDNLAAFANFAEQYGHAALTAIAVFYRRLWDASVNKVDFPVSGRVPVIAIGAAIIDLPFNLAVWLGCMRKGTLRDFCTGSAGAVAVVRGKQRERVIELHPLQRSLLVLCDGLRDIHEIAQLADWTCWNEFPGVDRAAVAQIVLDSLSQDGIVTLAGGRPVQMSEQVAAAV